MFCAIWYILKIWKTWKNPWWRFTFMKPATLLKVTLLHGCFSRILNCKLYQTAQCMAYLQNCRFWLLIWKRKKFLHSTILSETLSSVLKSSSFRNLEEFFLLTLSRRRPLSYRNQSIDLTGFYMIMASVMKELNGSAHLQSTGSNVTEMNSKRLKGVFKVSENFWEGLFNVAF